MTKTQRLQSYADARALADDRARIEGVNVRVFFDSLGLFVAAGEVTRDDVECIYTAYTEAKS